MIIEMRMKKIAIYLITVLLSVAAASCGGDRPDVPGRPAEHATLVYMVAANSLGTAYPAQGVSKADSLDLDEMVLAARRGDLGSNRWLVFHSTYKGNRLLELTASGLKELKNYGAVYATDAAVMQQVIADVKRIAPAENYGIVLWSHASGWLEDGAEDFVAARADAPAAVPLSYGQHGGRTMNTTTLRHVLEDENLEYIYFDCCLMGGVEVMYELRDCARYIVSSPSELPRDGMPYDRNLGLLAAGGPDNIVRAAQNTFELYQSKSDPVDRTATMTVVDTRSLERLAEATRAIYILTEPSHPLRPVTNYYGSDRVSQGYYLDFGEYVTALHGRADLDGALLAEFESALGSTVIYKASTDRLWNDWTMYNVSGLSTRVVTRAEDLPIKGYDRLEWTQNVVAPRFKTN